VTHSVALKEPRAELNLSECNSDNDTYNDSFDDDTVPLGDTLLIDRSKHGLVIRPYSSSDTSTEDLPLPERYIALSSSSSSPEDRLLCIDSGTTFSMTSHRSDFISYEPVSDMYIAVANGEQVAVSGRGTVRLLIDSKVVEERGWLHVPSVPMHLKSVRLHQRMHPDNAFLATHDECSLVYPSFVIKIDDSNDCVIPCTTAPNGQRPDFIDSPIVSPAPTPTSCGHAFQSPRRAGRKFVPFPQNQ
jgi:hypothetical protein